MFSFALGLILGGAIGNVIDRLLYGQVVDFLLFHQGNWYFPAFNVADCRHHRGRRAADPGRTAAHASACAQ